jgi:hypothetical protein
MITHDETTDAFTGVLDAAGAKPCVSCGRRAAVRTDLAADAPADGRGLESHPDQGDNAKWFCFACGHEEL